MDTTNPVSQFSEAHNRIPRSEIRETLKLARDPKIINFGGGLPDPKLFPMVIILKIIVEILMKFGIKALQYGTTEGTIELRKAIVRFYKKMLTDFTIANVVVTSGGQSALDLLTKLFINPGDIIITEKPSYLGALQVFRLYGAKIIGIEMDDEGIKIDDLRTTLKKLKEQGEKPKFIYLVPDFQNPSGALTSFQRRKQIIVVAREFGVLLVEDSPYRNIDFGNKVPDTMYSMDPEIVINLGTASKIMVPGFRIGWIIANEDVIKGLVKVKQATDLCTSSFAQLIVAKFMNTYLSAHLRKINQQYKEKAKVMIKALKLYMPEGVSWTKPQGGLFFFITLPKGVDAKDLFVRAIKKKVAFIVGSAFFPDGSGKNKMRINFATASKEKILFGVKALARAIKEEIAAT